MKKFTLRLGASSLSDMMRTKVTSLLTTGLLVFVLGAAGLSNPRLAAAAANCVINIPINIICTVVGPVINSIVCSPIITIIVFGDVHEQDANGEITSNQIPGDFVVSRTADGSHEVQTRNVEYVPSSGIPPFPGGATVAAAAAVKFAGHHAAVFRNTDSQPDLWLDGKPVETVVNGTAKPPKDAHIVLRDDGPDGPIAGEVFAEGRSDGTSVYRFVEPGKSEVEVVDRSNGPAGGTLGIDNDFLDVTVKYPQTLAGLIEGRGADGDRDPTESLVRDREVSIFDEARADDVGPSVDPSFVATPPIIDDQTLAQTQGQCSARGLTGGFLEKCGSDVGFTGATVFIDSALFAQTSASGGVGAIPIPSDPVTRPGDGIDTRPEVTPTPLSD